MALMAETHMPRHKADATEKLPTKASEVDQPPGTADGLSELNSLVRLACSVSQAVPSVDGQGSEAF